MTHVWLHTGVGRTADDAVRVLLQSRPDLRIVHVYPVHGWVEGMGLGEYLRTLVCPARRWWRVVCREAPAPPTLVPA